MLRLVDPSTEAAAVRVEQEERPPLEFRSVVGLVDVIAGNAPARLDTQLAVIWETSCKESIRHVLRLAVACRDPLSDLGTICFDALQTAADLMKLVRAQHWTSLVQCMEHTNPRACALVNLCDAEIERLPARQQPPYRAIRESLDAAAVVERKARGEEMRKLAGLRQARCPDVWTIYETWLDTE